MAHGAANEAPCYPYKRASEGRFRPLPRVRRPIDGHAPVESRMDAQRALLVLRRWWLILIAGTLLAAVVAYAVSKSLPRVYQATALLEVNPGIGTVGSGVDFNQLQASWSVAADDARLIATSRIAQAAIDQERHQLSRPIDTGTLLQNTKVQSAPESRIVTLSVNAGNPRDASSLANALATAFVQLDARARRQGFPSSQAEIVREIRFYSLNLSDATQRMNRLAALGNRQTPSDRAEAGILSERIATDQNMLWYLTQEVVGIGLYRAGVGVTTDVAQPAVAPDSPISPRTAVNTVVAAALTLIVLVGAALLVEIFDSRPRSPGDVAAALDVPLLGTIGPNPYSSRSPAVLAEPLSAIADEYRSLHAQLTFLSSTAAPAERSPILVTAGVGLDDDATTVAVNLGALAARTGARVSMVDANLREPKLHAMFGLPQDAGLAGLLATESDVLTELHDSGIRGLRVLPAGRSAAAAIDQLGSARMREILDVLRANSDLVVVAAAPAGSADGLLAAALGSATLLVAGIPSVDAAALAQIGDRLRLARVQIVGVAVMLRGNPDRRRPGARRTATASATELVGQTDLRGANNK